MKQLLSLCVLLLSLGCGSSSPTAPTPAALNITGQWTGTYSVGNCTENVSGFCAALGSGGGILLTPNQSGTAIIGTLGIGAFSIPVSGNINTNAVVALSGSGPIASGATLTLTSWRTIVTGSTMAGTFSYGVALLPNTAQVTGTATLTKQ